MLATIDDKKARMTGRCINRDREYLGVQTTAGHVFEIARLPISEEVEAQLMRQVRAIVAEEDDEGS